MNAAVVLEQKKKLDRKRLVWAVFGAILFHLWLLYFTFPEFQKGPEYTEVKHNVVLKRFHRPPPEKPKVKPPPKKVVKKPKVIIPVPDPTPDEPEEIQPLIVEEPIELPPNVDVIWGIPDAPDIEFGEPTERIIYNPTEVSKEPEFVFTPKPDYPDLARMAGATATVILCVIVDENGRVEDASVLLTRGGGQFKEKFEKEAIKAAYKYTFNPAIQSGHPVPCTAKININFVLE